MQILDKQILIQSLVRSKVRPSSQNYKRKTSP